MQPDVGKTLIQLRATLEMQAQMYTPQFFELGAEESRTDAALETLRGAIQRLWSLHTRFVALSGQVVTAIAADGGEGAGAVALAGRGITPAYGMTADALQAEIDFLEVVRAQGRGSTSNTRLAAQNAAVTLDALDKLIKMTTGQTPSSIGGTIDDSKPNVADVLEPGPQAQGTLAIPLPNTEPVAPPRIWLHRILADSFTPDDLGALALDLDVPPGSLGQGSTTDMANRLVGQCKNLGKLERLEARIKQLRPHLFQ